MESGRFSFFLWKVVRTFPLKQVLLVVVSTPLKNISQNGNLPEIGVNIKKIVETTTQVVFFVTKKHKKTSNNSHPGSTPMKVGKWGKCMYHELPKPWKNTGFGHLKTQVTVFTIKTHQNVGLMGDPW